ncbi:MAG: KEOPS complex subunit Cgi121, partial [Candidatus Diapherotrites archaeon]|nr:KEOPS complex subunit Cgi121 [Candidatus Diapherotrites archaeon]
MEKTSTAFGEAIIKDSEEVIKNILEILAKNQCFGQVLSSKAIVSEKHLLQAVEQTESAFANGTSFAKRKEMELLLRISGKKQFPKALEILGVKEG